MQLVNITLKGFGSYKNEVSVSIPNGITGIIGTWDENERKSNGSGKSTLVSSINYAFFGDSSFEKVVMGDLVNDQLDEKNMFVKVDFIHNGIPYAVERGMQKGSSYLNFLENGVTRFRDDGSDKHKSTIADMNADIIKVLGMDYQMFTASVFFEQDGMDKFINVRPDVLRQYIDKVLGIEDWRKVEKILVKEYNAAVQLQSNLGADLDRIKNDIQRITEQLQVRSEIEQRLNDKSMELEEREKERSVFSNIELLHSELNNHQVKVIGLKERSLKLNNDIDECGVAIDSAKLELGGLGDVGDIISLDEEIHALEQELEKARMVLENLDVSVIISDITALHTKIQMKTELRNKFKTGICSECEQLVTTEYVSSKQGEYDNEIMSLSEELNRLSQEKTSLDKSISDSKSNVLDLEYRLSEKRKEKNEVESRRFKITSRKAELEHIISIKSDSVKVRSDELKIVLLDIEKENEILSDLESKIGKIDTSSIEQLDYTITTIKQEIAELNKKLGGLHQLELDRREREAELSLRTTDLNFVEECLYIYNTLMVCFREIPKQLFTKYKVSVKDHANTIIQQVIPELSVDFSDDDSKKRAFKFIVSGRERKYKRLSGGQRVIADIGIRLGFSHVIKLRANSSIDLIVLDEPFGSLDEENRELIKSVFANMLEWFKQILVISHVGNIEYFPNIIEVRYSPDRISYIGA